MSAWSFYLICPWIPPQCFTPCGQRLDGDERMEGRQQVVSYVLDGATALCMSFGKVD
jgi:hypothetical protein